MDLDVDQCMRHLVGHEAVTESAEYRCGRKPRHRALEARFAKKAVIGGNSMCSLQPLQWTTNSLDPQDGRAVFPCPGFQAS